MLQRTFAMIKPDGVTQHVIGKIIQACEAIDLCPIGLRLLTLSEQDARALYLEHRGQDYYEPLIAFSTAGPVVVMALEGDDAVQRFRLRLGTTNPRKASPLSLRGQFGTGVPNNAVHGSDSPEAAERELRLFFRQSELYSRSVLLPSQPASPPVISSAA